VEQVWATLSRIAADRQSGASQIARAAAEALGMLKRPDVHAAIRLLVTGHPTMAPVWRLGTDVLSSGDPLTGATTFLRRVKSDGEAAAALAPELPRSLLTISFSSSVVETARRASVKLLVCMRSDPGGEGEQMALAVHPLPAQVMEDEIAIQLIPAEAVVVGADAVTPFGLINKVKTRALAQAARGKDVPRYVVAGETKFVSAALPVERPFEIVPLVLFTAIATPAGLLSPAEAAELAAGARLHPELEPLVAELSP
jgi:translation initiation factor 2B subunit (eIF-2B alpha/beta/delta family)